MEYLSLTYYRRFNFLIGGERESKILSISALHPHWSQSVPTKNIHRCFPLRFNTIRVGALIRKKSSLNYFSMPLKEERVGFILFRKREREREGVKFALNRIHSLCLFSSHCQI